MLRGALAAAVTPLRDGRLDADAVGPYVDFLAAHGLDGVLVLGTTGEGVLFPPVHRKEIAQAFLEAARGRLQVAVHAGAQTTHDTVVLAEHAAAAGAAAVAVIAPPYYALDEEELFAHFAAAARACAPVPFYLYEFEARSGYAIPLPVVERLRERAPNFAGMKVSDSPWERLEPYLVEGLDVFVGAEVLLERGLAAGAAGAVSGLAASFPTRSFRSSESGRPRRGRGPRGYGPSSSVSRSKRRRRRRSASAACRSAPRCAHRCAA